MFSTGRVEWGGLRRSTTTSRARTSASGTARSPTRARCSSRCGSSSNRVRPRVTWGVAFRFRRDAAPFVFWYPWVSSSAPRSSSCSPCSPHGRADARRAGSLTRARRPLLRRRRGASGAASSTRPRRRSRDVLRDGGDRAFVHHNLGIVLQQRGPARRCARRVSRGTPARSRLRTVAPARRDQPARARTAARQAVAELSARVALMPRRAGAAHLQLADACERIGDVLCLADEIERWWQSVARRSRVAVSPGQGLPAAVAVGSSSGSRRSIRGRASEPGARPRIPASRVERTWRRGVPRRRPSATPTLADVHLPLRASTLR